MVGQRETSSLKSVDQAAEDQHNEWAQQSISNASGESQQHQTSVDPIGESEELKEWYLLSLHPLMVHAWHTKNIANSG